MKKPNLSTTCLVLHPTDSLRRWCVFFPRVLQVSLLKAKKYIYMCYVNPVSTCKNYKLLKALMKSLSFKRRLQYKFIRTSFPTQNERYTWLLIGENLFHVERFFPPKDFLLMNTRHNSKAQTFFPWTFFRPKTCNCNLLKRKLFEHNQLDTTRTSLFTLSPFNWTAASNWDIS